jgi:ribosomal protein S18 acetylase RimI-like enzyme
VNPNSDSTWRLRGFTFGEQLGRNQSSITIEKTDLETKGLAQFIFSEFCSRHWGHLPFVNVGDDWGLPTLAWTKMSYRPVKLLNKFVLRKQQAVIIATGCAGAPDDSDVALADVSTNIDIGPLSGEELSGPSSWPWQLEFEFAPSEPDSVMPRTTIRAARKGDLDAAVALERANFHSESLTRRQLQYLQCRETSIFLVGEQRGRIVGDGIALIRQHRNGLSGRIYSLVVRAQSRGQKIGQKLLKAMIDALIARGVKRIYLEVEQANAGAIRLYEQSGFRAIGVLPDYYDKGKPGLHMMHEVEVPRDRAGKAATVLKGS